MLLLGESFYVANTDGLVRYAYQPGQTRIVGPGTKVLDLPADGYNNHWTRNVVARPDGSKLYVSVGSGTNVDVERTDEKDPRRAAILEANPDGSGMRVFASGLRNPVGMDWQPATGALWTAVNERDGLGDDLVPDYLTSVREGAFYGWPYSYFGQNEDPRKRGERPDLVRRAIVPDVPLGSHTASLGLLFYQGRAFPEQYRGGAFVAPARLLEPLERSPVTRSSSCPSTPGGQPSPSRTFSPVSSLTRRPPRSTGGRWAWRCSRTDRCSSPTMPAARSGA